MHVHRFLLTAVLKLLDRNFVFGWRGRFRPASIRSERATSLQVSAPEGMWALPHMATAPCGNREP